ncbi:hypothetical protein HPB48_011126 [Haemaphysalis longicornis]|uniref:Monocarboxylate transporter n=1 Tax=Haemaphysalis longicornis TaxID=44386 RepID=A0A9J6GS59_HAELO|nr:hypothetical protein HPB48_011126 [Haemaphysalis longicornis]
MCGPSEKEPRENPFCDTESCSAKRSEVLAPQKHSETAVFEISFEVSLDAQHGPANKPHEKHYVQDGKRSAQVESFKTISDSQSVLIRRGMKKIATSLTNADGTASGAVHAFFLTPALYAILATYVLLEFAHTVVDTTLVAYAMDKGHPRRAAEAMIMYRAAAGMTGRLAFTFVSDAFAFKRDHLVAFSIFAESLCFALLPQASSYRSVTLLVIGFSATSGTIFALKPVMMAEHLGVDMLTATWGLLGLCLVPVMLGSPFIMGKFLSWSATHVF